MQKVASTVLLVALFAAGCAFSTVGNDEGAGPGQRRPWTPPARYTFEVNAGCGLRTGLVGGYRITVVNDRPVAIEPLRGYSHSRLADALTIPGIVHRAVAARRDGANVATVSRTDAGIPRGVKIDWSPGIDDEECYRISHVMAKHT